MNEYTIDDGRELVKTVRSTMHAYLTSHKFDRSKIAKHTRRLNDVHGIFVVLYHYPTMETRGCIGIRNPKQPIRDALIDATLSAISEDPKHIPMSHLELDDVIAEVSILSKMEKISASKASVYHLVMGKHGLMIEYGFHSAMLLPTYAINKKLTKEQFMDKLCDDAGLREHTWKQHGVKLYRFTIQTFIESEPNGAVREVRFKK